MKSFFKYVFATIVGILIAGFLFFIISMGIIGAIVSSADKHVPIKSNSVLQVKFNYPILDRSSLNLMDNFDFETFKTIKRLGLNDILKNIEKAKVNSNVKGIFLDLTFIPAGYSTIDEIRESLIDFKKSGKFIIAFGEVYSQKAYYLASIADKIYLTPAGILDFIGLSRNVVFYKNAFEKLGIKPQIIRHGEYKSYVEPFIMDKMSKENKEQTLDYIGDIWNYVLKKISKSRNISVKELNQIANNLTSIVDIESAIGKNFIDGVKYRDEVYNEIKDALGLNSKKNISFTSLNKLDKTRKSNKGKGLAKNKIAVIYAQGDINIGEGDETTIGSAKMMRAISKIRKDTTIKAVVVRVNSPGGTILGSEIIRREIDLTAKEKIVVASMGDVAASGGYYVLCNADYIVANHTTITGSIGVLGIMYNAKEFLNNKLGLTSDIVKTNSKSDIGSIFRPIASSEKALLQSHIEKSYNDFVNYVANGRNMTVSDVDKIGRGRVWSGIDAQKNGLVDEIGGLEKAIKIAAEKANIDNYRIVEYPKQNDPFEIIMKEIAGEIRAKIIKSELGMNYKYYDEFKKLLKLNGINARLPYNVEFDN